MILQNWKALLHIFIVWNGYKICRISVVSCSCCFWNQIPTICKCRVYRVKTTEQISRTRRNEISGTTKGKPTVLVRKEAVTTKKKTFHIDNGTKSLMLSIVAFISVHLSFCFWDFPKDLSFLLFPTKRVEFLMMTTLLPVYFVAIAHRFIWVTATRWTTWDKSINHLPF